MSDCELTGIITTGTSLSGTISENSLTGTILVSEALSGTIAEEGLSGTITDGSALTATIVQAETVPGDVVLRLNATDGEQFFTITDNLINLIVLPLDSAAIAGSIQTYIVTLTTVTHSVAPTQVDIELLDDDTLTLADAALFVPGAGGSHSIFPILTHIPSGTAGSPLNPEESVINFSNTAERVFIAKGTVGNLLLAVQLTGGTSFSYTFSVQVYGKRFR